MADELMEPLATTADLEALNIDTSSQTLVESLLESVSYAVREAAGAPISLTTSTVTTGGTREEYMTLPGGPLREVASVTVDGKPVTDWRLLDGRLWRPYGWGGAHVPVEVTYTHGYDPVPADIVRMVCMFVSAGLHAAEDGFGVNRGKSYERGDDYQVGYLQGEAEIVDAAEIPERTRRMLRDRFGPGAYVTRGY